MWVLNTRTAELRSFPEPTSVVGGYAILSHVWGEDCQGDTFQSVRATYDYCEYKADEPTLIMLETLFPRRITPSADISTSARHRPPTPVAPPTLPNPLESTNARDYLTPLIRDFLVKADEDGFDWAWAAICCIDFTSSAEVNKEINLSYRYFALSGACYVYLSDVSSDCRVSDKDSEFTRSRWHTRSWTLQELVAPSTIGFFSKDWKWLGGKFDLAEVIEKNIPGSPPANILRFAKKLSETSVAERLSWAAHRSTSRVEDEAYSILGFFGIRMSTFYGEGRNAFYRLQEEIMRKSSDTSLFAWTDTIYPLGDTGEMINLCKCLPEQDSLCHLFSPSPQRFVGASQVVAQRIGRSTTADSNVSDAIRLRLLQFPDILLNDIHRAEWRRSR